MFVGGRNRNRASLENARFRGADTSELSAPLLGSNLPRFYLSLALSRNGTLD
jgi:hypothetical protein